MNFWSISLKQMFQYRLWVQCLWFLRRNVLITQSTSALFQHRLWVQGLWFLRRDVLITQSTSALFQHSVWVQCLWFLRKMSWSLIFGCPNTDCEFNKNNFLFCYMLIFHSWYVSPVLLYAVDICFIGGQYIIINYFILFISFFKIFL